MPFVERYFHSRSLAGPVTFYSPLFTFPRPLTVPGAVRTNYGRRYSFVSSILDGLSRELGWIDGIGIVDGFFRMFRFFG